jgi:hypothetical protein
MAGPYSPPWSTHEYTEQRLVTHTYAKAFSLNPRYQNDTGAAPSSTKTTRRYPEV